MAKMINVKELIRALRMELGEYGEMLALLEAQHQALRAQDEGEALRAIDAILAQGETLQDARDRCNECRRHVAQAYGQPLDISLLELIPSLPRDYQPLVQALVEGNAELLVQVRRRAKFNQVLLNDAVTSMQEVLNTMLPPRRCSTHGHPHASVAGLPPRPAELLADAAA